MQHKRANHGFTLIELMIVVIIVGILAVAAMVVLSGPTGGAYATEAKTGAGTIRDQLDINRIKKPSGHIADVAGFKATGILDAAGEGLDGSFYQNGHYSWTASYTQATGGRYNGTITVNNPGGSGPVVEVDYSTKPPTILLDGLPE